MELSMIKLEGVSFAYEPKKRILKNVSLEVKKGEWVSILGHNGSGKSTLAKTIIGLLEAMEGHIYIDGTIVNIETLYDIRQKVGIVFQNPDNQFVGVTVRDDIAFGMENLCFPKEKMLESIEFYAKQVGVEDLLDKEPAQLSGGQKQRVAIAGILAMETDIIIFDEATSMLDPSARNELMTYIEKLHQNGLTILMITHNIEEALYSDRVIVLKEGEIYLDAPIEEALKQSNKFEEASLELPVALQIANGLEDSLSNWKEYLWAYSLKK